MKSIKNRSKLILGVLAGIIILVASCKKDPVKVTGLTLNNTSVTIQVGATSTLTRFINSGRRFQSERHMEISQPGYRNSDRGHCNWCFVRLNNNNGYLTIRYNN